MNEKQLKIKILIIQSLDWTLIIAWVAVLFIAYQNGTEYIYIALIVLIGLGIIHQIGLVSINKIHAFKTQLHNLEQERKREEIHVLMSKGGQKVKKT